MLSPFRMAFRQLTTENKITQINRDTKTTICHTRRLATFDAGHNPLSNSNHRRRQFVCQNQYISMNQQPSGLYGMRADCIKMPFVWRRTDLDFYFDFISSLPRRKKFRFLYTSLFLTRPTNAASMISFHFLWENSAHLLLFSFNNGTLQN